jgi:hypothetical protein
MIRTQREWGGEWRLGDCVLVDFLLCTITFMASFRNNFQDRSSQAAFRTTFRVTGIYRKARTEQALKRVLEGFSVLVSDFTEVSRIFFLEFLHKKTFKSCENHQRSFNKYCFACFFLCNLVTLSL